MEKNLIEFNISAPYYKSGAFNEKTKCIWFIFHGYGQLAKDFQSKFSVINQDENLLIFPQGLSKFYLKGVNNSIGASWMTSEERETDIHNYLTYLRNMYEQEVVPFREYVQFKVLGFSQGAHTATRWIYRENTSYDSLILWGAGLANEINEHIVRKSFLHGENMFVVGDQDRFINSEALKKLEEHFQSIGFKYSLVKYQGTHDIYPEILKTLV